MAELILNCRYCGVKKKRKTDNLKLDCEDSELLLTTFKCYNCGANRGIQVKVRKEVKEDD